VAHYRCGQQITHIFDKQIGVNMNEPAFPIFPDTKFGHESAYQGMTLRDYFAAKAMQSVIATVPHDVQIESPYELASWSYAMADRMLKARGE
jgi:hypothetical protein